MTIARKNQVDLSQTKYYHIVSRCVRQAGLIGKKQKKKRKAWDLSQRQETRKLWIIDRMSYMVNYFCINILSYAIMNNHVHQVVHIDVDKAMALSDKEVLVRTFKLYPRKLQKYKQANAKKKLKLIAKFRRELFCISKFMSYLNYYIARRCNKEDKCTGRYWEGRFRSIALLTLKDVLNCMAYVDLNEIRAGAATNLGECYYSSIFQRVKKLPPGESIKLAEFIENKTILGDSDVLPFEFSYYLKILETLAAAPRDDKSGYIKADKIEILSPDRIDAINRFEDKYSWIAGPKELITKFKDNIKKENPG